MTRRTILAVLAAAASCAVGALALSGSLGLRRTSPPSARQASAASTPHRSATAASSLSKPVPWLGPTKLGAWDGRLDLSGLHLSKGGASVDFGHAVIEGVGGVLDPTPRIEPDGSATFTIGSVEERYRSLGQTAEVSWRFSSRLPSITVTVPVKGARLERTDDSGIHLAALTERIRFGHGTLIDAAGRRTPVPARFSDGAVRLEVPSATLHEAEFPAVLDPIIFPEQSLDAVVYGVHGGTLPGAASDGVDHFAVWVSDGRLLGSRVTAMGESLDIPSLALGDRAGGWQDKPQVVFDGSSYLVVWTKGSSLLGRHLTKAGKFVEPAPVDMGDLASASPMISVAWGAGELLVAWQAGASGVLARRFGADLAPLDASPIPVANPAARPSVASAGDTFLVAFEDWDSVGLRASFVLLGSDGVPRSTTPTVLLDAARELSEPVAVSNGTLYLVAWRALFDNTGVHGNDFAIVDATGAATLLGKLPYISLTERGNPSLAISLGTDFVIVAPEANRPFEAIRVDAAGTVLSASWTPLVQGEEPCLSSSQTQLLVAFHGQARNGETGLVGRRFDAALAPQEPVAFSIDARPNSQGAAQVACTASQCLVTWSDNRETGPAGTSLLAARTDLTGKLIDPTPTRISGSAGSAHLATDGERFLLLWNAPDEPVSKSPLLVARVEADGSVSPPGIHRISDDLRIYDLTWNGDVYLAAGKEGVDLGKSTLLRLDSEGEPLGRALVPNYTYNAFAVASSPTVDLMLLSLTNQFQTTYYLRYDKSGRPLDMVPVALPLLASSAAVAYDGAVFVIATRCDLVRLAMDGTLAGPIVHFDPDGGMDRVVFDGTNLFVFWIHLVDFLPRFVRLDPAGRILDSSSQRLTSTKLDNLNSLAAASNGRGTTLVAFTVTEDTGRVHLRAISEETGPLGAWCSRDFECLSGHCADGVCCDGPCGGSDETDCLACSLEAGAAVGGVCGPAAVGTVCRPSQGPCDPAETCRGALACPPEFRLPSGHVCLAAKGCMKAGACNGTGADCPWPSQVANATPCAGDACTVAGTATCQSGICRGQPLAQPSDPCLFVACQPTAGFVFSSRLDGTSCSDADPCHGAGTCRSGRCVMPRLACADGCASSADGTPCDDGDACTQTDTCQAGRCVGSVPVVCANPGPCLNLRLCDPATGTCRGVDPRDGPCDDQDPCTGPDLCDHGLCRGAPVACTPGPCRSDARCDPATGVCLDAPAADGTGCDDQDGCTVDDRCLSGTCRGTPAQCSAADACHQAGACQLATGRCSSPPVADGTPCASNACVASPTCQQGTCGGPAIACGAGECLLPSICDPATGQCQAVDAPDGWPCDDGDPCTSGDQCLGGECKGAQMTCPGPTAECRAVNICDPTTGACASPAFADGTPCDDANLCTVRDACVNGACVGVGVTLSCPATDECHVAGKCDPATGKCSNPARADGSGCSVGTCRAGVCMPPPGPDAGTEAARDAAGTATDAASESPDAPLAAPDAALARDADSAPTDASGAGASDAGLVEPPRGCGCASPGPSGSVGLGWLCLAVGAISTRRRRASP